MPSVRYFSEGLTFSLPKPRKTTAWIKDVVQLEGQKLAELNFIFCTDPYLHNINIQYLQHDTYTDIVTFDNSDSRNEIEGDIFISIDRIRENAASHKIPFNEELHRVIIHGVLHLIGYSDKTKAEKNAMRQKEDQCLSLPSVPRETFL